MDGELAHAVYRLTRSGKTPGGPALAAIYCLANDSDQQLATAGLATLLDSIASLLHRLVRRWRPVLPLCLRAVEQMRAMTFSTGGCLVACGRLAH